MTTPHRTLQMALDALQAVDSGDFYQRSQLFDAIAALREALAAPEPEPVARCILDNGDEMGSVEWLVRPRYVRLENGSLLYAAPPAAPDHLRDVAEKVAPAAPAQPAVREPKFGNKRVIFQAGRDSYKTACEPMNTDDEAWNDYLNGITGGSK